MQASEVSPVLDRNCRQVGAVSAATFAPPRSDADHAVGALRDCLLGVAHGGSPGPLLVSRSDSRLLTVQHLAALPRFAQEVAGTLVKCLINLTPGCIAVGGRTVSQES